MAIKSEEELAERADAFLRINLKMATYAELAKRLKSMG